MEHRKSESFMQLDPELGWVHEGENPRVCKLYQSNLPVHKVLITEVSPTDPSSTRKYWAWWENKNNRFEYVYRSKSIVEMCFTYGPEVEEKRGRGKLCEVTIEDLGEVEESIEVPND